MADPDKPFRGYGEGNQRPLMVCLWGFLNIMQNLGGGWTGGGGDHTQTRIHFGSFRMLRLLPESMRMREREREREREMFYLTTHSTHFIYGYMASDIWLRTILIVRKETRCRHIGYSYRLTARVLLYAPSHIQDNTYHGRCYTSRGALAGTINSSMGPRNLWRQYNYVNMFMAVKDALCT